MNAEGKQEFICRQCSKVKCPIEKDDRHAVVDCKHFTHHPIIKNNTTPTETTAGHTPGPWQLDATERIYTGKIIRHNGVQICRMIDQVTTDTPEVEANARLIAAAPDLLDACKKVVQNISPEFYQEEIEALEAAIDKAESPA